VLENILHNPIRIVIDEYSIRSPLVGALTGFKYALGKYSILLPNDTPLISTKVVSLLLQLVVGLEAVIPIWPNNYIEPLQAIYETETVYEAALQAFEEKKYRLKNMIMNLTKLMYVSTTILKIFNGTLNTFLNVNTLQDIKEVENQLL
jgi:molybdopterin-guanine dinucleotide biosynthesis protein A